MKVMKNYNANSPTVIFYEGDKLLRFTFGGNGDLCWAIHTKDVSYVKDFVITKENYGVYQLFEQLFKDIEEINLYDIDEEYDIPFYIETEEEKAEYIREREKKIENQKKEYRLYNRSNYNELYDKDNQVITWYSDETAHEVANVLRIKKREEDFLLNFSLQPHIKGYDEDFHSPYDIPIRFRNSGSSYEPFNFIFMRMYNNMDKLDDVNDIGHQMHIEEYLYNKGKTLVKKIG